MDIVVPCYNYGRFLEACVRSALTQSVAGIRVLIIDDASSDDSVKVALRLAMSDSRVSLIVHPANKGHIATFNEGIAWASSDYFLLLSADDLLAPGALRRAVDVMESNLDVVLTYGECVEWHESEPRPVIDCVEDYSWGRVDLLTSTCSLGRNLVSTPTVIVRTDVQKAVGGYRSVLPHAGDMEMWLRFAASGSVARIDAIQAIYRKHSTAMSNAYYATILGDCRQVHMAFETFFDAYETRLAGAAALRARARIALAGRVSDYAVRLLRRARFRNAARLISYAIWLDPRLLYRPPIAALIRMPGRAERDRVMSRFWHATGRRLGSARRLMGRTL